MPPAHPLVLRSDLERASAELDRCSPVARRVFELVYDAPGTPDAFAARPVRERARLPDLRLDTIERLERARDPAG
jgi:hypothetical protein